VQNKPHPEIGMVFQQYSLLPWRTVEQNIVLGLEFERSSAQKKRKIATALFGIDKYEAVPPCLSL
jgi:ABC-type nitrate/sulfonate/bicarbonate transport system ATPase subunit